jgi:chromosome segregation ATPase
MKEAASPEESAAGAAGGEIAEALARFSRALDRLDATVLRRLDQQRGLALLEAELDLMREDRAKLAEALDIERDQRAALLARLAEVSPRIERAMAAIAKARDTGGG